MHTLSIDTSTPQIIKVSLEKPGQKIAKQSTQKFGSQVLLNLIEEILHEAHLEKAELEEIKVATGPGSYTGLRVGVAVANALGFGLGIPVNGKQLETDLQYN